MCAVGSTVFSVSLVRCGLFYPTVDKMLRENNRVSISNQHRDIWQSYQDKGAAVRSRLPVQGRIGMKA